MSAHVCRAAAVSLTGLDGTVVMVEAAVSQQLPGMAIIGLPDAALAEAKLRVRTATGQIGLPVSSRFVTVNLSPAALPKHGSGFDLAIALAALAASQQVPESDMSDTVHLGELGLSGELRRPAGLLTAVVAARAHGFARVMVPSSCVREAQLVPGIEVVAVAGLLDAVAWYRGERRIAALSTGTPGRAEPRTSEAHASAASHPTFAGDMSDVIGQPEAVEALVVAAAGRHHLSLLGPPGAGKTLLATRLTTILPPLTDDEALQASCIASLGGDTLTSLVRTPPFESPHHTASTVAIIGGGHGSAVRPGAITRACHGTLLMDEAPEFNRDVLEALRQPLESGTVEIHRSNVRAVLPARFQLVLASNPCPCGNAGSVETAIQCTCTPIARMRYQQRISGPLSDRIDLRLNLHRVSQALVNADPGHRPTSAQLRERVIAARSRTAHRLRHTPWRVNAEVPGTMLRGAFKLDRADTAVLDQAYARGAITMRGYDRALRIAWSVADLAGIPRPGRPELAQALALRGGDRT
ncbi:magnesium chelatase family protein [Leucobacter exalbidus]|uniref:Magnesium chelatase family protein n=1 Tax=Leucobacter exalbidus TaxID=662960 RepID=A0A940T2V2_9MICO|nr:YifB family Mg chelatase-like AAA ATPase [Leucobacter exalbidus]MBP1325487.1 magnesium chelatase family protein [Leucobacter exalbidus]